MTWFKRYAKTIVASMIAGLTTLQMVMTDGVTWAEGVTITLAVLGVWGVYRVPNTDTGRDERGKG